MAIPTNVLDARILQCGAWNARGTCIIFFLATHFHFQPQVDKSELEDAQWFTRSQVTEAYQNSLKLHNDPGAFDQHSDKKFSLIPLAGALAHTLIKRWVLETAQVIN